MFLPLSIIPVAVNKLMCSCVPMPLLAMKILGRKFYSPLKILVSFKTHGALLNRSSPIVQQRFRLRITVRSDNILQICSNNKSQTKAYLKLHPDFLQQCFNDIDFLDINQSMLKLFKATDKKMVFDHVPRIFYIHIHQSFSEQLLQLWEGNYYQ